MIMPKVKLLILSFISISCFLSAQEETKSVKIRVSDGPYLFYQDNKVVAKWVEKNKLKEKELHLGEEVNIPSSVCPDFIIHYEDLETKPSAQENIHFKTTARIAAISDVHGQYPVTVKLLQAHGIIDDENNWAFGNGHLVVVGDIFDRGDQVTEIFWLLHKLEKQAPKAGGRVHTLLGNHELMVLGGDLRYVHKKYRYTMALLRMPMNKIYDQNTYLGTWLRSKPLAITINDMAFVHGGFSEFFLEHTSSIKGINKLGKKLMDSSKEEIAADTLLNLMNTMDGPLWYRGYFDKQEIGRKNADRILKKLNKSHIIVGHTSHDAIVSLFDNRIIGVDSSIKFGKRGEILIRERDGFYRGTIKGEKIKL